MCSGAPWGWAGMAAASSSTLPTAADSGILLRTTKKLLVRAGPTLNSEFVGELSVDTHLIVLDVEEISQNDSPSARRAKVADALARVPLGWVTVAKGGTDNLARVFSSVRTSPRIPLKQLMTRSPNGVRAPQVSPGSAEWVTAVENCVLFDGYREPALVRYVEQAARPIRTRVGELLFSQDDFPNMMYLVHSGSYRATIDTAAGQTLAREYGPSDCFGACELLCVVGGRSCTVTLTLTLALTL